MLRPLPFVTLLLAYPGLLGLPPLTLPGFPLLLLAQLNNALPLLVILLPRPLCQRLPAPRELLCLGIELRLDSLRLRSLGRCNLLRHRRTRRLVCESMLGFTAALLSSVLGTTL